MQAEKYRLKATKSTIYSLCKRYANISVGEDQARFPTFHFAGCYALNYWQGKIHHSFLLAGNGGQAHLRHQTVKKGAEGQLSFAYTTYEVPLAELLEVGLAEPMPARGLRETASQQ